MSKFTVDTHLFRELGELLVGRDSTALVELIKNAYDADATSVLVYGEALEDPERGFIKISDDGIGMTHDEFEEGFLRIASRSKEQGDRFSKRYHRRFTGSKGIGRLAAHKIARVLEVQSIPWTQGLSEALRAVDARIDWDIVEQHETLDKLPDEVILTHYRSVPPKAKSGTTITLRRLRRRWSPEERGRFLAEVQTFEPPLVLASRLPKTVVDEPLLFERAKVRDAKGDDPGFHTELEGDFALGESYWQNLAEAAAWIIEIDALSNPNSVRYVIAPTLHTRRNYPSAPRREFPARHPDPKSGPFFQGRILVREGPLGLSKTERVWASRSAGVRVFLEGFRILPYGERGNDWLSLDADYTRRTRSLPFLEEVEIDDETRDADVGLVFLPNQSYFGAIFLTRTNASSLRMLVNREGFVPESGFKVLEQLVRTGIDLATRVRASARLEYRAQRKQKRAAGASQKEPTGATITSTTHDFKAAIDRAASLASKAEVLASEGNLNRATKTISEAASGFKEAGSLSEKIFSEGAMIRVLASVGTQMAAFVHEITGLLGMAQAVDTALDKVRQEPSLPRSLRADLGAVYSAIGDLKRRLELQASYLIDVVTPDARRRRSRQSLADRFDAGRRLIEHLAEQRSIRILNEISPEIKSPPMFPAELTTVFSNLLTNAVKAAGRNGRIRAVARRLKDGRTSLIIENTGVAVHPEKGERWFKPFESTTVHVDPVLGQGMGLGLPITRSMLEEYGAEIRFANPTKGYATAIEILFPD